MKQRVDRFFAEGINASLLHLVIHQLDTPEEPGIAAWFGNEFNRKNTWFDQLDLFTDYLRRCNYVLQQGRYIADAAYFIGEDAPKMTGECNPALPEGYSFDYINADILKNHAKVVDGRPILDSGMEYRVLVLPNQDTMRPEMLECIKKFVEDGPVVLGPAPVASPSLRGYPEADARVKEIAATMWTPRPGCYHPRQGQGICCRYIDAAGIRRYESHSRRKRSLRSADAGIYTPYAQGCRGLLYRQSYRRANINQSNLPCQYQASASARTLPTAQSAPLPQYRANATDNGISIPVVLEPLESAFIVFRKDAKAAEGTVNYPEHEQIADPKQGYMEYHIRRRP